jgi:phosphoribosylanthranilate isomerase
MVWPVVRIAGTTLPADATALATAAGALVLDAKVIGQLGGTGVTLDWKGLAVAVAALRRDVPQVQLILAGGLRPANVADAIALLHPDVVDVSSGVESSVGVKDPEAMVQFVQAVDAAKGAST